MPLTEQQDGYYTADFAWANNAAANTVVTNDGAEEARLDKARLLVSVHNPSTETALTVTVRGIETFGGAARYPRFARFTVPVNETYAQVVDGAVYGDGLRVEASNDTAVGLTGAFTANVAVRRIA